MSDIMLIEAWYSNYPSKTFPICEINEGRTFMDPLEIFNDPDYDVDGVNSQGWYAIGGELDVDTLLTSYKWGIFPWFAYREEEEAFWYCPKERYVIFPDKIHVGHTLRNLLNKNKYHITIDKDFKRVIHNCRMVNFRDSNSMAWLGEKIENLFIQLNELGYAKSVEVWEGDELIGGFYGFWYKGIFQGESMFSLKPSASQVGLVLLCQNPYIEGEKIKLIDTQFETPTFKHLGAEYISYQNYRKLMEEDS